MTAGLVVDFDNGGQERSLGDPLAALPDPTRGEVTQDGEVVNAATNPDLVNKVTQNVLGESEEEVLIEMPLDGSVQLLAGYIDEHGQRWTTAEVRELRGRDEEQLERAYATGDMVRYIDAICRAGVVQLGPVEGPTELAKAMDTLLIGDRDMLVMAVRRMAFGDTQRLDVRCPFCEAQFKVDYSYSKDVPLKRFDLEDRTARAFDVELPKSGQVARVRLVDGRAQKLVFTPENVKKTESELNTLLLAEVVDSIGGVPVKGVGPILDMRMKDRLHLLKWLVENQPGPQYADVKQECADCVREFPLVMTLREMFRGD